MLIYLKKQAQIQNKARIKAIIFNKAFTIILAEYFNYNNIFLAEYIVELLEYIKINDHVTKLKKGRQLFFRLFYNLKLVELETLKTYIKSNLANDFIYFFKSPAKALILYN